MEHCKTEPFSSQTFHVFWDAVKDDFRNAPQSSHPLRYLSHLIHGWCGDADQITEVLGYVKEKLTTWIGWANQTENTVFLITAFTRLEPSYVISIMDAMGGTLEKTIAIIPDCQAKYKLLMACLDEAIQKNKNDIIKILLPEIIIWLNLSSQNLQENQESVEKIKSYLFQQKISRSFEKNTDDLLSSIAIAVIKKLVHLSCSNKTAEAISLMNFAIRVGAIEEVDIFYHKIYPNELPDFPGSKISHPCILTEGNLLLWAAYEGQVKLVKALLSFGTGQLDAYNSYCKQNKSAQPEHTAAF